LLTNFDRVKSLQLDFFDFVEQRRNKLSISQKYINYKKQINNHSVGTIYSSESNNVVNLTVSFDIYCKEMIAKHSLSRVIYDTLIIYYKERAKLSNDDMAEGLFEVTKEFEISQSKKIKSISEDVFKLKDHYEIPKGADFIFLKNTHGSINTESKVVFQQKLSTPEELFIKNFLDVDKGNIKCWFKNFDNGDNSLSFVYQINNELHIHTPDFICLDNNNKLKLFEVKDNTLAETTSNINRAKFNALSDLLKQNNFSFSYDIMFVSQKQILQMGHSQNNII